MASLRARRLEMRVRRLSVARPLRVLTALTAVVALVPLQPAPAASAAGCDKRPRLGGEIVTLCRTTVLSGNESGFVRVRIAKDASLSRHFEVVGAPLFTGFALTPDDPERSSSGTFIVAGRMVDSTQREHPFVCCDPEGTLSAGVYRLYLLARGPAKVTLKIKGLAPGTTSLSPAIPTSVEIKSLRPTVVGGAAPQYYAAGELGKIQSEGLAFAGIWVRTSPVVAVSLGSCLYFGDVPDEVAFAPQCPWAPADRVGFQVNIFNPETREVTFGYFGFTYILPRGQYDQSVYAAVAGRPIHTEGFALWLSFDPPGT